MHDDKRVHPLLALSNFQIDLLIKKNAILFTFGQNFFCGSQRILRFTNIFVEYGKCVDDLWRGLPFLAKV